MQSVAQSRIIAASLEMRDNSEMIRTLQFTISSTNGMRVPSKYSGDWNGMCGRWMRRAQTARCLEVVKMLVLAQGMGNEMLRSPAKNPLGADIKQRRGISVY